jgi:hypothetical protein
MSPVLHVEECRTFRVWCLYRYLVHASDLPYYTVTPPSDPPETLDDNIGEMVGEEHEVLLAVFHQLLVVASLVSLHVAHQVTTVPQLIQRHSYM